ncbi:MAG: SUMF1/EgtB/PvdO family nonheme iron enzyme [Planctomycetes bacterium]|nr:SUMF1/EgtB/PvdO family nonheme iron enzyme [Planctomycetota bacterium]
MTSEGSEDPWQVAERVLLEEMGDDGAIADVDIDRACARAPQFEREVRELYRTWLRLAGTVGGRTPSEGLVAKLSEELGPEAVPSVVLARDERETREIDELLRSVRAQRKPGERYRSKDVLGRGGMGQVVRAWDADLKRFVAMKLLRGPVTPIANGSEHPASARTIGRFLEEAQVTAQLDHPGIVPVHDIGVDELGRLFFTMRMVRGVTLEVVFGSVRAGLDGWTTTRAVSVLLKACEALAFAHDRRVVHRDLKPANIMVGRFGEVYVVDWGLARLVDGPASGASASQRPDAPERVRSARQEFSSSDSSMQTEAGDVIGTPAYMSPEQAAGERDTLDERSDVYSMGAILYQLLAGARPYSDEKGIESPQHLTSIVAHRGPTPLIGLAPSAPDELVAICDKAMSRQRERRYASMLELSDDLRAYLENRVVKAHRTGVATALTKWMVRNRALVLAVGGAALILSVVLAAFSLRLRFEIDERERIRRDADRVNDRLRADDAMARALDLGPMIPSNVAALEQWLAGADSILASRPGHEQHRDFPDEVVDETVERQWRELFGSLDALALQRSRLHADLERARTLRRRSIEERDADWRAAIEAIAREPRYALPDGSALRIEPQLGLVPLGPDQHTGLWEFAVLDSGTLPRHSDAPDNALRWEIEPSTAIVLVLLPGATATISTGYNLHRSQGHALLEVELHPFFAGKYEVTQAQWWRTMGSNPSAFAARPQHAGPDTPDFAAIEGEWCRPVESVTWTESQRFAAHFELRLMFDAQADYAVYANSRTRFWFGEDPLAARDRENISILADNSVEDIADACANTSPVGAFEPNALGLFDSDGNVSEWTRSTRLGGLDSPPRPGDGAVLSERAHDATHLVRGMSWHADPRDAQWGVARNATDTSRSPATGLRVARPLWPCPACPPGAAPHE